MRIKRQESRSWHFAVGSGLAIAFLAATPPLRGAAAAGWGPPTHIDSTSPIALNSVSCPSSSFCVAVDLRGDAVTYNGTSWTPPAVIEGEKQNPDGTFQSHRLTSVSCPSTSFCMAVDENGNAVSYNGTSWSAPADVD